METLALYSLISFLFLLAAVCCWFLIVLVVLSVMRFNAWASRVERSIKLSRGRTY